MKTLRTYDKNASHQIYKLQDGTRVPGASTVAKIGEDSGALLHWAWDLGCKGIDYKKARDEAADIGSLVHFMVQCHLRGDEADTSAFSKQQIDKAENCFLKFLEFWEQHGWRSAGEEQQLVSETYKYGGTFDCVAEGEKLILLDWKTSKAIYDPMIFQVAAYRNLWNEHHPDRLVGSAAIVRIGKDESLDFEVRFIDDLDGAFQVFLAQLTLYHAKKSWKKV